MDPTTTLLIATGLPLGIVLGIWFGLWALLVIPIFLTVIWRALS